MPQQTDLDALLGPAPQSYAQPEAVVLRLRRHGRRLVLPLLALVAIAAAAGFWVGALHEPWMNVAAGAGAAVLALLLGVAPVLAWLTRRVTVTSRRVILRHGVLVRHRSEIPFSRVREVRSRRTLWQRMHGSGTIDLLVGAERLRIDDVPGVVLVADALQELVERNYEHSTHAFGAMGIPGTQGFTGLQGMPGMPGGPGQPSGAMPQAPAQPASDPSRPVSFW